MNKRPFGRTGLQVTPIGFGGAPAAFLKSDHEKIVTLLNAMLDAGVNVLDTAAMYPGSEQFIGENLGHRRGDYVLISKCGTKLDDVNAPAFSAELIAQSIERSLKLLRTDVIDVMLLHSCDLKTLEKGEALAALMAAKKAGKIRFAGYSGDNDAAAFAVKLPDVMAVETSVSICDQWNIDHVLSVAQQEEVGVIAKRPLANAAWKKIEQQPGMYQSYAKNYTERFAAMHLSAGDLGFPETAWPEIALRFTLSQPGMSTAVIGTTSLANAQANLAAAEKGPLPPETVQKIRDAFARADKDGHWQGLT